ncbi:MFS transporter [Pandoraea cepalis]|uniref:MFS transporter n=1 Tax=Pandoraea cepalis TaxID=2508294 RepID=A0A5E4VKW1_9BURK|nr:MFS transporter [Pandoraea cepalis]VVE12902.1 MFS transporter [Pandoraea cepalis]
MPASESLNANSVSERGVKARATWEAAVYRKIGWRLIPLLIICYTMAYLDRVNVGFAKMQMMSDLKLSDTIYGLGAGIFFIGYVLAEVPSNIILHRVGARRWIARIMVTWGLTSAAMVFVSSPTSFYVLRFLLGVAEAGFFPGIIYYLMNWYPTRRRGSVLAMFYLAAPFSAILGGPLSGALLKTMVGIPPLSPWQWMFVIEAIPAIVLGIVVLCVLKDRIEDASWLQEDEKRFVRSQLSLEDGEKVHIPLRRVFGNKHVWHLSALLFTIVMAMNGVFFWMPTLITESGIKDPLMVGLLSAVPYLATVPAMLLIGRHSDKTNERRWHMFALCIVGMVGFLLSIQWQHSTMLLLCAMTLATMSVWAVLPLFWTVPTAVFQGVSAAAGIAMINSLGVTAGFVAPYMVGVLRDVTGSTNAAMYVLAALWVVGGLLVVKLPADWVARK